MLELLALLSLAAAFFAGIAAAPQEPELPHARVRVRERYRRGSY